MSYTDRSPSEISPPSRLPDLLPHLREQAGWSQAELAERAGVDQSLISRVETGTTRRPQRQTLQAIATAFQKAGMRVTAYQLEQAADAAVPAGATEMDSRLIRLYEKVSTYPPQVQDAFYDALYATFRVLQASHRAGQDQQSQPGAASALHIDR